MADAHHALLDMLAQEVRHNQPPVQVDNNLQTVLLQIPLFLECQSVLFRQDAEWEVF